MTTTDTQSLRPTLAWPVQFTAAEAQARVHRRLKEPADLTATLYHHPFLGLVFRGRQSRAGRFFSKGQRDPQELVGAHVLVDLVGGRAFLSDGWDPEKLVAIERDNGSWPIEDPEPQVDEFTALRAARALLASVVLRRRRFAAVTDLELVTAPLAIGKPNWWVTDRNKRSVEVIVDGITGKHYAFSV